MNVAWFDAFHRGPEAAIADLFSGRAGVDSGLRLDVPELLYQAFPPELADDRARLDSALLSWLLEMREGYASQVKRLGFSVYGKRVGDALIALQLLDLPESKRRIREDLSTWLRWLLPLRVAPERDPALECFRLLTRGQPDIGYLAMWLRLASDPRPEYLTVALTGLQLLPNQDNAQKNQMLMLQALLRHAVKIRPDANAARTFFSGAFSALRGLFPRSPQHWKRVMSDALDGFLQHTDGRVARALADALRTTGLAGPYRSGSTGVPTPVKQEEWTDLQADIRYSDEQTERLSQRLFNLLKRNHEYAEATGVSHFFVHTLHNLGTSLMKRHRLGQADMTRLGLMIERSLFWEPTNSYCWMLWAFWLRAQGYQDAHESILREMLRMFPSNPHAKFELASLLSSRGADYRDEADYWAEQANRHGTEERHPGNLTGRQPVDWMRADVYLRDGDLVHSREAKIREAASGDRPVPLPDAMTELSRRGRLAGEFTRAQIAKAQGRIAPTVLIRQETMKGDPLAGFYSQWLTPEETPECPPHAWAWSACRHWQESASLDDWRHLATRFPEAVPETEFLRVLARPDDDDQSGEAGWRSRYGSDDGTGSRAIDVFLREAQKRIASAGQLEREELAVEVLACAAADAPEFALEWAA